MITVLLLLLILVSLWIGFYQIVKQQGRILLRLDELERNHVQAAAGAHDHGPHDEPPGLPLESEFPAFSLPGLEEKPVTLADFRGRRVLLVHWNFECGFCDSLAPELARLEPVFERQNIQLLLLAHGEAPANRAGAAEHGLKYPILLLKDQEGPGGFENEGTPVAYLLDEEARVAAPVARGADRVLALLLDLAGPEAGVAPAAQDASELGPQSVAPSGPEASTPHRMRLPGFLLKNEIGLGDLIKRFTSAFGIRPCAGCERRADILNRWMVLSGVAGSGLKAGTPAPDFQLPDLAGHAISLNQYRGRRVLLFFSDPQCGPCDELSPDLVRVHREHLNDGLSVLMVGRGLAEENQRKAEKHGFEFPVLLQDKKWKVSKEYGTLATPAAFLIGEDGVIIRDPAVGKDAILALLHDSRGSQEGRLK